MKHLFLLIIILVASSCDKDDKTIHIKVWTESSKDFIVLLDNPIECQYRELYSGYGIYEADVVLPLWSDIRLIAQVDSSFDDPISVEVDGVMTKGINTVLININQ